MDYLLDNGADVNVKTTRGVTPLHYAVETRRDELVLSLLIHKADANEKDLKGNSPVSLATQMNARTTLRLFKNMEELREFIEKTCDLPQYFVNFAKEEIFCDVLSELNDNLLETIGITTLGHKIRILNAIKNREKTNSSGTANPEIQKQS